MTGIKMRRKRGLSAWRDISKRMKREGKRRRSACLSFAKSFENN